MCSSNKPFKICDHEWSDGLVITDVRSLNYYDTTGYFAFDNELEPGHNEHDCIILENKEVGNKIASNDSDSESEEEDVDVEGLEEESAHELQCEALRKLTNLSTIDLENQARGYQEEDHLKEFLKLTLNADESDSSESYDSDCEVLDMGMKQEVGAIKQNNDISSQDTCSLFEKEKWIRHPVKIEYNIVDSGCRKNLKTCFSEDNESKPIFKNQDLSLYSLKSNQSREEVSPRENSFAAGYLKLEKHSKHHFPHTENILSMKDYFAGNAIECLSEQNKKSQNIMQHKIRSRVCKEKLVNKDKKQRSSTKESVKRCIPQITDNFEFVDIIPNFAGFSPKSCLSAKQKFWRLKRLNQNMSFDVSENKKNSVLEVSDISSESRMNVKKFPRCFENRYSNKNAHNKLNVETITECAVTEPLGEIITRKRIAQLYNENSVDDPQSYPAPLGYSVDKNTTAENNESMNISNRCFSKFNLSPKNSSEIMVQTVNLETCSKFPARKEFDTIKIYSNEESTKIRKVSTNLIYNKHMKHRKISETKPQTLELTNGGGANGSALSNGVSTTMEEIYLNRVKSMKIKYNHFDFPSLHSSKDVPVRPKRCIEEVTSYSEVNDSFNNVDESSKKFCPDLFNGESLSLHMQKLTSKKVSSSFDALNNCRKEMRNLEAFKFNRYPVISLTRCDKIVSPCFTSSKRNIFKNSEEISNNETLKEKTENINCCKSLNIFNISYLDDTVVANEVTKCVAKNTSEKKKCETYVTACKIISNASVLKKSLHAASSSWCITLDKTLQDLVNKYLELECFFNSVEQQLKSKTTITDLVAINTTSLEAAAALKHEGTENIHISDDLKSTLKVTSANKVHAYSRLNFLNNFTKFGRLSVSGASKLNKNIFNLDNSINFDKNSTASNQLVSLKTNLVIDLKEFGKVLDTDAVIRDNSYTNIFGFREVIGY